MEPSAPSGLRVVAIGSALIGVLAAGLSFGLWYQHDTPGWLAQDLALGASQLISAVALGLIVAVGFAAFVLPLRWLFAALVGPHASLMRIRVVASVGAAVLMAGLFFVVMRYGNSRGFDFLAPSMSMWHSQLATAAIVGGVTFIGFFLELPWRAIAASRRPR